MIDFSKVPLPDAPSERIAEIDRRMDEIRIQRGEVGELSGIGPPHTGEIVDLNLDGAKRTLRIFDFQISEMELEAKILEVNSESSAKIATEMTGQVKRIDKAVDDRRKEIIAQPDSFVRKVNGFVKPIRDRLKGLEAILKRKLGDYAYQQELQRREIERLQREEAAKLQEDLNKEAEAKGVEPVQVIPVSVTTRKEPTRSDGAVASSVIVWKHEVVDLNAVPREYLMANDLAIKTAIRAGIRNIEGVRIYEEAEMRVRRVG